MAVAPGVAPIGRAPSGMAVLEKDRGSRKRVSFTFVRSNGSSVRASAGDDADNWSVLRRGAGHALGSWQTYQQLFNSGREKRDKNERLG